MARALESVSAFFQDTPKVGTYGRYDTDPFMVPVNEQIVFFQEGVGVHGEQPRVTQVNPLSLTHAPWEKLPQITCRNHDSGEGCKGKGHSTDEIPPFHGLWF
jgi:hypothetical protein